MAADDLELARSSGCDWALAISLRAAGLVRDQAELVEEAVQVAAGGQARLEQARALCDLGAMHRRNGGRRLARQFLEQAAEVAESCQARSLARRADQELSLCGGRRRSSPLPPHGLTPGEQRVAGMALGGLSNPEIAQALFVSLRTVETHLTHIYRKLGIDSRRQLPMAMARPVPARLD